MSCMAVSLNALARVRETLVSSFYWREQSDEKPLGLCHAFTGRSVLHVNTAIAKQQAREFVEKCFIFNSIEYFKGEQAKSNAEPIEWGDAIFCAKYCKRERLSIMQFYKTLRMIDYNTNASGWLTKEQYENWARKDEYEVFKSNIKDLTKFLAEFLVTQTQAYQDAEWCIK